MNLKKRNILSTEDLRKRLASAISPMLHHSNDGLEVWHSEYLPETGGVLVHDFTFVDDTGTQWRGEFKLDITEIEAYVDADEED